MLHPLLNIILAILLPVWSKDSPPPPLDLLIKKLFVCYFNWNVDYSSGRQKVVHIPYQASH